MPFRRAIDPGLMQGDAIVGRAVLGGLAGTALLTVILYTAPLLGMPAPDMVAWLSLNERTVPFTESRWWAAMAFHVLVGTFGWPLLYAVFIHPLLPGPTWARGLLFGFLLWLVLVGVVAPGLQMGALFALTPRPEALLGVSLVAHLVYGLIVVTAVGPLPRRSSRARLLAWKAYR